MAAQHWTRRERGALAQLGIPFHPKPEDKAEKVHALCGWCFHDLNDCIKGKAGCCGFGIDSGDTAIQ